MIIQREDTTTDYNEPELRLVPKEDSIDYTTLDSPDGYETLPVFYCRELVENIPAILIKIFGRKLPFEFYLHKAKELAFLFGEIDDFADAREFITPEDLEDLTIEEPPLRDFSAIEELREQLLQVNWDNIGIADILYMLSELDSRQALGVAYCFGLLPDINGLRHFYETYGVSRQILDTFAVDGYKTLQSQVAAHSPQGVFRTIIRVRKFLKEIINSDGKDLIKFKEGPMVGYESVTYQLAQHVIEGTEIELELLTKQQRAILKMFKRYYKQKGTFPRYEEVTQATGLSQVTIYKHIQRILEIIENCASTKYYRTKNGKLMEMDSSSLLARVFEAYAQNPALAEHINLSELQKRCFRELFAMREELNVAYPGIGEVAQRLNLNRRRVVELFATALVSIEKEAVYYEKTNEQLSSRDIRVQVIARGGIEYINGLNIRSVNKQMIALLLELNEGTHTFKYTVAEVAELVGAKTNNPSSAIYDVIKAILKGGHDYNVALADRRGVALTRNHLVVVELLQKKGLASLQDIKPEWNYQLAEMLLQKDEHGRYYEYEYIEQQLGYVSSAISEGVKRIIAWLGEV